MVWSNQGYFLPHFFCNLHRDSSVKFRAANYYPLQDSTLFCDIQGDEMGFLPARVVDSPAASSGSPCPCPRPVPCNTIFQNTFIQKGITCQTQGSLYLRGGIC